MFTNDSILHIAMQQSAIEYNCAIDAFMQQQSVITLPCASTSARKYLDVPFRCSLVSYGKNVVACAEKVLHNELRQYLDGHKFYRCLTSPAVFELNEIFASVGLKVGYMSEYFLPDVSKMQAFLPVDDKFELRRLGQADFASLYLPQWSHALCSERKELDILGMAAYDLNTFDKTTGEPKLIGLAACSMDCEDMWQIGIDILPEYRGLKLAPALTSRLSGEIFKCGKIPFYCASWANIPSVRNAGSARRGRSFQLCRYPKPFKSRYFIQQLKPTRDFPGSAFEKSMWFPNSFAEINHSDCLNYHHALRLLRRPPVDRNVEALRRLPRRPPPIRCARMRMKIIITSSRTNTRIQKMTPLPALRDRYFEPLLM